MVGSEETVSEDGDYGLFSAVMESYNNHWALVTSPEDWHLTVIRKIARAVDKNSRIEKVRQFFVDHAEGKKELTVTVPEGPLNADYDRFVDEMVRLIEENVEVKEYVEAFAANFSTSTSSHRIAAGITLMNDDVGAGVLRL